MKAPMLLLVCAIALAACGDDVTAKYRSGSENAANDFRQSAVPELAEVRAAPSANARIGALEAFRTTVEQAAAAFARLEPPDKVKRDNAQLVSDFHRLASDILRYEAALRSTDRKAQDALAATVQRDFGRIERTSARITAAVGA